RPEPVGHCGRVLRCSHDIRGIAPDASLPDRSIPIGNINDRRRLLFKTLGSHISDDTDYRHSVGSGIVHDHFSDPILSGPDVARGTLGNQRYSERTVALVEVSASPQCNSHSFEVVLAHEPETGGRALCPRTRVAVLADGVSPDLSLQRQRADQPCPPHPWQRLDLFQRPLIKRCTLLVL